MSHTQLILYYGMSHNQLILYQGMSHTHNSSYTMSHSPHHGMTHVTHLMPWDVTLILYHGMSHTHSPYAVVCHACHTPRMASGSSGSRSHAAGKQQHHSNHKETRSVTMTVWAAKALAAFHKSPVRATDLGVANPRVHLDDWRSPYTLLIIPSSAPC